MRSLRKPIGQAQQMADLSVPLTASLLSSGAACKQKQRERIYTWQREPSLAPAQGGKEPFEVLRVGTHAATYTFSVAHRPRRQRGPWIDNPECVQTVKAELKDAAPAGRSASGSRAALDVPIMSLYACGDLSVIFSSKRDIQQNHTVRLAPPPTLRRRCPGGVTAQMAAAAAASRDAHGTLRRGPAPVRAGEEGAGPAVRRIAGRHGWGHGSTPRGRYIGRQRHDADDDERRRVNAG